MNENLPHTIDRFEIIAVLGKGSMGIVYKAFDPVLQREIAIKTVEPHFGSDTNELEKFIERFKREAIAVAKLNHPNIVTIFDFGFIRDTTPYIAMELINGKTLKSYFEETIRFDLATIKSIVIQIASALEYAHKIGIVHRDVKPANIMILENYVVKIADFGIARLPKSELTRTGEILGTPNYMSPEQITGTPADHRVDLFSLGIILYQILTGERPFVGETFNSLAYRIVHEKPLEPKVLNPSIPQSFSDITMGLLEKDKTLRPSLKQLIDTLNSYDAGSSSEVDLSAQTILAKNNIHQMPTEELRLEEVSIWERSLSFVQKHFKTCALVMATLIVFFIAIYLVVGHSDTTTPTRTSNHVPNNYPAVKENRNTEKVPDEENTSKKPPEEPSHEIVKTDKKNGKKAPVREDFDRAKEEAIITIPYAKHMHTFGSCRGTLILTKDYIFYDSTSSCRDKWHYDKLRGISRDGSYLNVKTWERVNLKVGKIKLLNMDYKDYKFRLSTTALNKQIDELLLEKMH